MKIIVQHVALIEKVDKTGVNRFKNGIITDTLKSVDIQEIVGIGATIIDIYVGVLYKENFAFPLFRSLGKTKVQIRFSGNCR